MWTSKIHAWCEVAAACGLEPLPLPSNSLLDGCTVLRTQAETFAPGFQSDNRLGVVLKSCSLRSAGPWNVPEKRARSSLNGSKNCDSLSAADAASELMTGLHVEGLLLLL